MGNTQTTKNKPNIPKITGGEEKLNFTGETPPSMLEQKAKMPFGRGSGGAFLTYSEIMMKYKFPRLIHRTTRRPDDTHGEEWPNFFGPLETALPYRTFDGRENTTYQCIALGNLRKAGSNCEVHEKSVEHYITPKRPSESESDPGPLPVFLDLGGRNLNEEDFCSSGDSKEKNYRSKVWQDLKPFEKNEYTSAHRLNIDLIEKIIEKMRYLWKNDENVKNLSILSMTAHHAEIRTLGQTFFDIDEHFERQKKYKRTGEEGWEKKQEQGRPRGHWSWGDLYRNYGIPYTTGKTPLQCTHAADIGARYSSHTCDRVFSTLLIALGKHIELTRTWVLDDGQTLQVPIRIVGYCAPKVICTRALAAQNIQNLRENWRNLLFHAELMCGYSSSVGGEIAMCPYTAVTSSGEHEALAHGKGTFEASSDGDRLELRLSTLAHLTEGEDGHKVSTTTQRVDLSKGKVDKISKKRSSYEGRGGRHNRRKNGSILRKKRRRTKKKKKKKKKNRRRTKRIRKLR